MYSINDAYIEAWQKATNNKLNEAAPLGDDVYNKVLIKILYMRLLGSKY